MICPKCQDLLRTLERNGVHIEQCERCGGVFLDRGELEQLVAAERNHYSQAEPAHQPTAVLQHPTGQQPPAQPGHTPPPAHPGYAPPPAQPGYAPPPAQPGYAPPPAQPGYAPPPAQPGYAQGPPPPYQPAPGPPGGYGSPHAHPHRRRSFLEELFD